MFTGIVEERGAVVSLEGTRLTVGCRTVVVGTELGSSIAVSGVCLTAMELGATSLGFDLSDETIARTSLGNLAPGDRVNLERPVTLATRLGGHLVQGHVDGVGRVARVEPEPSGGTRIVVAIPDHLLRYIVEKGSVTVDGVSLTVAAIERDGITVALIPHTLAVTTLGEATPGDPVNIEVDVLARYVERLMGGTP
jgi:riboflavin synthase